MGFRLQRANPVLSPKLKKNAWIVGLVFSGLLVVALLFRQSFVERLIKRGTQRFTEHYQAELSIDSFAFDGLSGLSFSNITLKPAEGDTLMRIGYLHTKINMGKLIGFRVVLGNLEMKDAWFNFVRHDSITNYLFLLGTGKKSSDSLVQPHQPVDYADRADRLLSAMFDQIPSSIIISKLHVEANLNSSRFGFFMRQLAISGQEFETQIVETDNGKETPWVLRGALDAENRSARFKIFAPNHQRVV